eukprot:746625-Hanusia_phi.AAC.1
MEGKIVIAPLTVPIPMSYNVTLSPDAVSVIFLDIILDDDSHENAFNVTVNGPQQMELLESGDFQSSGDQSGALYQVIEVSCALVSPASNCSVLSNQQVVRSNGNGVQNKSKNITFCYDETYTRSTSLINELMNSHPIFMYGIISKVCTYNENNTEIYNVTGYNYTCLPPCSPTLYTYQIIAPGCIRNCTNPGLICHNTYGLYPNEYACFGGIYNGQPCLGPNDAASCFSQANPTASCQLRDSQPGIVGPDLKNSLDRSDLSLIVHAVYYGDLHFLDWLHRGVQAVWNEVATDVAAGLGYQLILEYLIRNGCPWRDSAIDNARLRGHTTIAQYLTALKPPTGTPDYNCGCASFSLLNISVTGCIAFSKGFECIQKCGSTLADDPSCIQGKSNYLNDHQDSSLSSASPLSHLLVVTTPPALARCPTGSSRALIRGPMSFFLSNETNFQARSWTGSREGFSDQVVTCHGQVSVPRGQAPKLFCSNPGPLISTGITFDFLNYHLSDKYFRVIYIPQKGKTGRVAQFNFTTSRIAQYPQQDYLQCISYSTLPCSNQVPIAARFGFVNITIEATVANPTPEKPLSSYILLEDQVTVMKLRLLDFPSFPDQVSGYIKDFPQYGTLFQVIQVNKQLNLTVDPNTNASSFLVSPNQCITSQWNCESGNCNQPLHDCYYVGESFVLGEPVPFQDATIEQAPKSILNSSAHIQSVYNTSQTSNCFLTDRYGHSFVNMWAGEMSCDLISEDIVGTYSFPSHCQRCMRVDSSASPIPNGSWTGNLHYQNIFVSRYNFDYAIQAPNDPDQGGTCSINELCRLGSNTASKSSCIPWDVLGPDGRPTAYGKPASIDGSAFSWKNLNPGASGFPCKGLHDKQACARNESYLWPAEFEPYASSRPTEVRLTEYGDPVDPNNFYSICGQNGINEVMVEYSTPVYMTGFDIHHELDDDVFFRVLAFTEDFITEDQYVFEQFVNRSTYNLDMQTVYHFASHDTRMVRNRTKSTCSGREWREVWRGYASEGRLAEPYYQSIMQGKSLQFSHLRIRIQPTNFSTKKLLIQSCGLMYEGPGNEFGGNVLEGLQNLMLIGTVGNWPRGWISNPEIRLAYVPFPNFNGRDTFSFYAKNFSCQSCLHFEPPVQSIDLDVRNVNDVPEAIWKEVTGTQDTSIDFELQGIDASPDGSDGWVQGSSLAEGAGQGSSSGVGPFGPSGFSGRSSPDHEPDRLLTSSITSYPQVGTLTSLGQNLYRFTPPPGAGGNPLAIVTFVMRDVQGAVSKPGKIYINYNCKPGYRIDQASKTCTPCSPGYFKVHEDSGTSCAMCVAGTYSPSAGSTTCFACPPGKFASQSASNDCMACSRGTYAPTTNSESCQECAAGKYAPRAGASVCYDCGQLAYSPLPGMFRCYDCPRLSRSSIPANTNVSKCQCVYESYRNAIFDNRSTQLWSPTGLGVPNGSFVAPSVLAIQNPWPVQLQLFGSNCSACPDGSFCHGLDLSPVTRTAYWTDWSSPDKVFWPDHLTPQFYKCNYKNIREVCLGYPLLDTQEQLQICHFRKNYAFCPNWPSLSNVSYTKKDPARCKAGYDGVICSQCLAYELQQCVPKGSDSSDGWFSWKQFTEYRGELARRNIQVVDCYSLGECRADTNASQCSQAKQRCLANGEVCTWQTGKYYRSFDNVCRQCPVDVAEGFLVYLIWFASYGSVVMVMIWVALIDLNSYMIMLTFWQTAALLVDFRISWPPQVISLLSLHSISNLNIVAVPWMCFFNWQPNYLQRWILTNLILFGIVGLRVVFWILPFLILPPKMKTVFDFFVKLFASKSKGGTYKENRAEEQEISKPGDEKDGETEIKEVVRGREGGEDQLIAPRKEAFLVKKPLEECDGVEAADEITPIEPFDEASLELVQTPSRKNRRREGWTEYSVQNVYQSHIPKMIRKQYQHKNSWLHFSVPSSAVDWRMRKKYFDMAWREAVAVLNLLYIMGCTKTLEVNHPLV